MMRREKIAKNQRMRTRCVAEHTQFFHIKDIIMEDDQITREEEKEKGAEKTQRRCTRQSLLTWGPGWKVFTWFCVMIVYLLLGGLFFFLAERPNEMDMLEETQAHREELANLLSTAKEEVMKEIINATKDASAAMALSELVERVANVSASLALASQEVQAETSPLWTYSSSIFFCATVITTIGYGNTAPVTSAGRSLFVLYAIIGIPICVTFLGLVGGVLASILDSITKRISNKTEGWTEKHRGRVQALISIALILTGFVLFIVIPAVIFSAIEGWTYRDAVYYCFVTLTTVGFGDFVAGQGDSSETHALYRLCVSAWVLVGLAWLALILTKTQTLLTTISHHIHLKLQSWNEKRRRNGEERELKPSSAETARVEGN